MIKYSILFSMLFSMSCSFAQSQKNTPNKTIDWGMNLHLSNIFRSFENMGEDTGRELNFGFGVDAFYQLSNRVILKSGLGISRHKFNERNYDVIFNSDIDPATGMVDQRKSFINSRYELYYLNIPIEVRLYRDILKKGFYLNTGVQLAFEIGRDVSAFVNNGVDPLINYGVDIKTNDTQFSTLLGLGYEFHKDRFSPYLEGTMLYYLTSLNQSDAFLNAESRELELRIKVGVRF